MNPIQFRISAIIFTILIGSGAAFGIGAFEYLKLRESNRELSSSLEMRNLVDSIYDRKDKKTLIDELQEFRERLEPEERKMALSDLIQAYSNSSWSLLKKRIDHFESTERKYAEYLRPKIKFYEKQVMYFSLIGLGIILIGLIGIREYVGSAVFNRTLRLGKKMMDFLNGRYSYKFEVPKNDEVGELETTFNTMAQRVLHNMEELEALDRAKSEFLSIASHELRTPMTSIKGSLGLLTSGAFGDLDVEVKNMIGIAEKETDRLIRLINEILDLAKIEARQMPMKRSWVSLDTIIQDCLKGLEGLSKSSGVPLTAIRTP
ncbi:MAG: hypothetical protein KDD25_00830, partial [Bdellovibrionales bacterium]|nr:hypothetical protein [Bdellovibrionales bacterium]